MTTVRDFYEQQAFEARQIPNMSIDDGRFIDNWEVNVRKREEGRVEDWARDLQHQIYGKRDDLLDRLDANQAAHVRVRKAAERNERPWQDLSKELRVLDRERLMLEQAYRSLLSSQDRVDTMLSDPLRHLDAFYENWPTLADRRPNLWADLVNDRQRRGVSIN